MRETFKGYVVILTLTWLPQILNFNFDEVEGLWVNGEDETKKNGSFANEVW